MSKPVKVLIIEDSEDDAKLALRVLQRGGFEPTHRRVQTAAELETALARERWDAIISDFSMPGFTGMDALRIYRSTGLDIPFILISGTIGEESAVNAMKAGASDYVMKRNLARLAPALERELKESHMRAAHRRAQRELVESEQRLRTIVETEPECVKVVSQEGVVLEMNAAGLAMLEADSLAAVRSRTLLDFIVPEYRAAFVALLKRVIRGESGILEFEVIGVKGGRRWLETHAAPLGGANGEIAMLLGITRDITERKTAENRIAYLNRVYAMLSGINTLIVRVRDRDTLFREACRIAVVVGGFRMTWIGIADRIAMKIIPVASAGVDEEMQNTIKDHFSLSVAAPLGNTMAAQALRDRKAIVANDTQSDPSLVFGKKHVEAGVRSMAVLPLIVSDEAVGVLVLYASEIEFFHEEELRLLSELAGDIAFAMDHIEKQERLDYLAYYDVLTGLANRRLFLDRVAQYTRSAVSGGHQLAILLFDLERFKNINDSLGQPAGDELLRQVAQWLTGNAGDAHLLARVNADHFAAVLPEVKQESDVARFLEKTIETFLAHPFGLNGAVFRIAVKIGIALFPDDGTDADTLFKKAEAALKKAKASGERYLFYTQKMTASVAGKLTLENQLRQALDKGEFVLHYQPKVNLASGNLTGAEALIRWNDPRTGLVPPGRFIPILEEIGLIYEVGRWALRKAIEDSLRWRNAGLAAVRIAVNVSPLQLRNRGFIAEIRQAIDIDALAAAGLELEITESLLMEDVQHSIAILQAIRDLGVTLAIDDFGTGFSSLSYLSKFAVDTLKIDRSFVIEMSSGPESLALVSTIISLAHALKLKVVAEGVETENQSRLLRVLNCDEIQGYLFSKPLPGEIFETRYLTLPSAE
ncbi:MAG: EAL domain-containing protein [Rhodoferax sp.]|nr:EAL domain-containing protein [Rhodoferax sp.]